VTGGSRGIGAAIAVELARGGIDIALVGRDTAALDRSADAVRELGRKAVAIAADLRDPGAAATVAARAVDAFGGIDILINSAGATKRDAFLALDDADWADGFDGKFFAAVRLCRACWPYLKARGGRIVNIAGVGGHTPAKDFAIGGSVNAALIHFGKALADLGRDDGVRVNTVNPGYIETERLTRKLDAVAADRQTTRDAVGAELLASIGVRRFGKPEEVARLVGFLVSADADFVDGSSIDIDGGWRRST